MSSLMLNRTSFSPKTLVQVLKIVFSHRPHLKVQYSPQLPQHIDRVFLNCRPQDKGRRNACVNGHMMLLGLRLDTTYYSNFRNMRFHSCGSETAALPLART